MIQVLFGDREAWPDYEPHLPRALAETGIGAAVGTEAAPDRVDYVVTSPDGWITDFTPFTRAKAVLNLWAGVEGLIHNATLTQPLVRMIEPGLGAGMVEWVAGQVLRHHLGLDRYIKRHDPHWDYAAPPVALDRTVAVLGLGELGQAAARALAGLGFQVLGWSRSAKEIPGVRCFAGQTGLVQVLPRAEILVLLVPLTPATENLIGRAELAQMPKGAVLINPGRGPLLDDQALLAALDSGQISHATLDVFREEPLPEAHPFWAHPGVTVTPHVASATRPKTASQAIAQNIRRAEAGEPLLGRVDRSTGY